MAYWRLYYHVVWATKDRAPLMIPEIEVETFRVIASKCREIGGFALAINGTPDHIHLIAAEPPATSLADFVKNLKGTSSRFIHTRFEMPFEWQAGYGIFTISERNLKQAISYVRCQKQHHAAGTAIPLLERCTQEDHGPELVYVNDPLLGEGPSTSVDDSAKLRFAYSTGISNARRASGTAIPLLERCTQEDHGPQLVYIDNPLLGEGPST